MLKQIVILSVALSLSMIACGERTEDSPGTDTTEERVLDYTTSVTFVNQRGTDISEIRTAVADDDRSRSEGLMNVTDLPEDAGMIFIFDDEQNRNFYMANTPLSLDILFVNADYEIVRIHRNTTPYSSESIPSEAPAKYVVEVNAGYTLQHDINEGDSIRFQGY